MINTHRLKNIGFKVFIASTFLLNLIAIPVVFVYMSNYIKQINMEKIYDNFEAQNVVFSNALTTMITQKKMEFSSQDVFDAGYAAKYIEIIEPRKRINGEIKIIYGKIHLDVEPIPGAVKRIWTEFPEPYRERTQEESRESMKKISKVFADAGKRFQGHSDALAEFDKKNYVIAMEKFKAISGGNSGVSLRLGLMYKNGLGAKVDYQQAEKWFMQSADLDNTFGIEELAKLYEERSELNGDFTKIAERYFDQAQYGDVYAQRNLAKMYEDGRGVGKNLIVARTLYSLSIPKAEAGPDGSVQAITEKLSPEQIEESTVLADKILRDGHLKSALSEYLAQKSLQDSI